MRCSSRSEASRLTTVQSTSAMNRPTMSGGIYLPYGQGGYSPTKMTQIFGTNTGQNSGAPIIIGRTAHSGSRAVTSCGSRNCLPRLRFRTIWFGPRRHDRVVHIRWHEPDDMDEVPRSWIRTQAPSRRSTPGEGRKRSYEKSTCSPHRRHGGGLRASPSTF